MKKHYLVILFLTVAAGLVSAQVNFKFRDSIDKEISPYCNAGRLMPWIEATGLEITSFSVWYEKFPMFSNWVPYRVHDPEDQLSYGIRTGFGETDRTVIPYKYFASALDKGDTAHRYNASNGYCMEWCFMVDKEGFDWLKSTGLDAWLRFIGVPEGQIDWAFWSPLGYSRGIEYPKLIPGKYDVWAQAFFNLDTGDIYMALYLFDGDGYYPVISNWRMYREPDMPIPGEYVTAYYKNQAYVK